MGGGGADCGRCEGVATGLDVTDPDCGIPADAGMVHWLSGGTMMGCIAGMATPPNWGIARPGGAIL